MHYTQDTESEIKFPGEKMFARKMLTVALAAFTLAWTAMSFAEEVSTSMTASDLIADGPGKATRLWYDEPAPDSNAGWVNRSIPMGNGYMGVNVFGGTTSERIQITENSLYDWAAKNSGLKRRGVNNFAEVYLDFGHNNVTNYERELDLNEGISHVEYQHDGVEYSRQYFTSYPDKVMAIRLNASKAGALSFTLRPTIPFWDPASQDRFGGGRHGDAVRCHDILQHRVRGSVQGHPHGWQHERIQQ